MGGVITVTLIHIEPFKRPKHTSHILKQTKKRKKRSNNSTDCWRMTELSRPRLNRYVFRSFLKKRSRIVGRKFRLWGGGGLIGFVGEEQEFEGDAGLDQGAREGGRGWG